MVELSSIQQRLCAEAEDTTSEYAKEGTDAHTLCEYKDKTLLGIEMQTRLIVYLTTMKKWKDVLTIMQYTSWKHRKIQRVIAKTHLF